MPKHPLTKAALARVLAQIHPDPEVARELIAMGLYRLSIKVSAREDQTAR